MLPGASPLDTPLMRQMIALDNMCPVAPKQLDGDSFRAPAVVRDRDAPRGARGAQRATVDTLGGGFEYTIAPASSPARLAPFPKPEVVVQRIVRVFKEPDVYGEWFYAQMHPEARLSYGGRAAVQWWLSSKQSLTHWIGFAKRFRVLRLRKDFRDAQATIDFEVELAQGGTLRFGVEFKRNDAMDTYLQQPPKMDWRIWRFYPLVQ